MATTELCLLNLTHLHKLTVTQQSQFLNHQNQNQNQNQNQMWNPNKQVSAEEDSWEVRAFAEDTGGPATWPPRSYTCAFCRREFRSAQALGGHMNVHRRDRARLHGQLAPPAPSPSSLSGAHASFLIPAASGVCLLYQLQNPSSREAALPPPPPLPPSTLLSISPAYGPAAVARNFLIDGDSSCRIHARVDGEKPESDEFRAGKEELDLELRLGHGPTPS